MDVDLLRPGTVPISPETVLWFEFLLDPDLLRKHLSKPRPDPLPTELIIKFTNAVLESIKNDTKRMEVDQTEPTDTNIEPKPQDTLKNLALKILTLKVAAYLRWNLDILDTKLPLKIQINVFQDLFYFTNEKTEIPNIPECDVTAVSDPFLFALILYHRWIVRMAVQQNFHAKIMKPLSENIVSSMEEFYMFTNELVTSSVNFLNSVLAHGHYPHVLMFDTFKMLTEDSKDVEHDWDKSLEISRYEYESQIHYDLGCLHFNRENYDLAKQHFQNCDASFKLIKDSDLKYASFDMKYLKGYLCACNVPVDGHSISLLLQMNASIADQYTGIIPILQKDNLKREIPMVYRTILELDIQGALSSGKFTVAKGLLLQVQMLNVIRMALDGKTSSSTEFIHRIKYGGPKATEMLFRAANSALEKGTIEDKNNIKNFFVKIFMSEDLPELLESLMADEKFKNLMNQEDLNQISQTQTRIDDIHIPSCLLTNDWLQPNFTQKRNPYLENRILEQKLISSYDPSTIKDLITQLNCTNPSKPIWRLNSSWELPIPLHSIVVSMQRSQIQDLSFVLLAKSKEMMIHKDYEKSQELLSVLETEIKSASSLNATVIYKLNKLISWEALLIKITDLFEKWPGNPQGRETLIAQCKQCLSALEDRNDSVLPRSEVIERCALCLLNCSEWEYLCGLEKRWNYFEMAAAVAYACQDLSKYKGSKKVSRDMWDLVLPIFGLTMAQSKRSSTGNPTMMHRDSPNNANNKSHLLNFLSNLRDLTALSVVISMLARLYNVLRDEPNLELNIQYITLWPAVISNANAYNTHAVFEMLLDLTQQALKFYPNNIAWLRLIADLNYGNSHYETSLCNYIESIIIATDYFNQPICKTSVDEHVIKRMIKCCTNINCHTQAAILTQFLDETDYSLAFKCLSESKTLQVCYDSVDAYYGCIWDTTLLEYLVHLHHKRGEHQRKQQAIKQIGTLELNSNNNEEIQREAVNTRKSRFMRALAKQFLTKTV